ncbi:MAG: hypothetical protein LBT59_09510 [Clostridiales bacterium]|jgi:hypothetical protein|nr:hypothetical protein [Clostridiales bacterium]
MKKVLSFLLAAMLLPLSLSGCAKVSRVEMTESPSSPTASISELEVPEYDLCTLVCFARPKTTGGYSDSIVSSPGVKGRVLGLNSKGAWIAKAGKTSLSSGKLAATLETDFLAVAYSNENKEFRLIVNDTVYQGKGSMDLAGAEIKIGSDKFEITGLALYKGLLSLDALEKISGIPITKGRSSYPIEVRYVAKQERQMSDWLSPGDPMKVSMKEMALYDPTSSKDRILILPKGSTLYLGNPGAEAGYENVTTEDGVSGIVKSLTLIYGTTSEKKPYFDKSFNISDALGSAGHVFGVPLPAVLIIWLALVPALYFLSLVLLNTGGGRPKFSILKTLAPSLLVASGYFAANLKSLFNDPDGLASEIAWFYSSIHLTPARFTSFIHWALYIGWILAIIAFIRIVVAHVQFGGTQSIASIPCAIGANLLAYSFFEALALLFTILIFLVFALLFVIGFAGRSSLQGYTYALSHGFDDANAPRRAIGHSIIPGAKKSCKHICRTFLVLGLRL